MPLWRLNSRSLHNDSFPSDSISANEISSGNLPQFSPALRTVLLLLFVAALLYVIPSAATYHGDERYYTDASLRMMQTGDYWTPYFSDGRIRLLKPGLTYWVIVASFKSLGVSLLAARLPFVLAGALVLAVLYQLGRAVLSCRQTALLGAALLAANFEFLTLATRSTPDILLCLFVLTSMWGFARIWFEDDRSLLGPLLAFVGMGLAIQTKGLLGLSPLGVNLIFALIARPGWEKVRRLFRWEAILTGLVIALFWYVMMWSLHGGGPLQDFFSDQVTKRVEHKAGSMLENFVAYLFAGFRHFLPWTLLISGIIAWRWRDAMDLWSRRRREWLFLLLMFAILVMVFSMGSIRRPRYLITAYPFLALFIADFLAAFWAQARVQQALGWLIRGIALLLLPTGVLLLITGLMHADWRLLVAGGLLLALASFGWWLRQDGDTWNRWLWLAGASLGIFVLIGGCIRPVFSPEPLESVAKLLTQSAMAGSTVETVGLDYTETGILRVLTGGQLNISEAPEEQVASADNGEAPFVITTAQHKEELAAGGYRLTRVVEPCLPFAQTRFGQAVLAKARRAHNSPAPEYWLAERSP